MQEDAGMSDATAIVQEKAALRQAQMERRDAIPRPMRMLAGHAVMGEPYWSILSSNLPKPGGVIATYVAMRSEFDPGLLVMRLVNLGYKIACPRVTADGLVFHQVKNAAELEEGPFGTRQPKAAAPILKPDLFLAPLLAFDDEGYRLGYGKAYYDRAFAAHPNAKRVGLAFAAQRVDRVPREAHDVPLHAVLAVET
jgi:5-formyltetrahydrofolate cyclo-ligase